MSMKTLYNYFPNLTEGQLERFSRIETLYKDWNLKINVVSRKDIDELYLRHVLHSLAIAKIQDFKPNANILDVGTGGGFPGIPLAIMFPETQFHLVDSIQKKIKVVEGIVQELELSNVKATCIRAENLTEHYDFIISRAVTKMEPFVGWVRKRVAKKSTHELKNGILYLKGGDLTEELQSFPKATIYNLSNYFDEPFFETKKVVHLPLKYKI